MKKSLVVAIIGGGRWASVHLKTILQNKIPHEKIIIVTEYNYDRLKAYLIENNINNVHCIQSIEELIEKYAIDAAIISNKANMHLRSSLKLLKKRMALLIEKPVVLSKEEVKILINEAQLNKCLILPGFCYKYCTYIEKLKETIENQPPPKQFKIQWHDSLTESVSGSPKTFDMSISVIHETLPHIWSIIDMLFPNNLTDIKSCISGKCNESKKLSVSIGNINGEIEINRQSTARRRIIEIILQNDQLITMDFTKDPVSLSYKKQTVILNSRRAPDDMPLQRQYSHFLSLLEKPHHLADHTNEIKRNVLLTERAFMLDSLIHK